MVEAENDQIDESQEKEDPQIDSSSTPKIKMPKSPSPKKTGMLSYFLKPNQNRPNMIGKRISVDMAKSLLSPNKFQKTSPKVTRDVLAYEDDKHVVKTPVKALFKRGHPFGVI